MINIVLTSILVTVYTVYKIYVCICNFETISLLDCIGNSVLILVSILINIEAIKYIKETIKY